MSEKIQKAGAIVLSSNDKNKIALLHRGKQDDWSFPKGHVDSGENAIQTMTREIKEETGLTTSVVKTLPDLEYIHSDGSLVSTKMFLVKSKDDSELKLEFESDDVQWILKDEVIKKLTYDNLKDYFKTILPIVNEVIVSL